MDCIIIGLGRIGSALEDDPLREKPASHAGAAVNAGCSITAGCDIDPEKRLNFSKRWKCGNIYGSVSEMLDRHSADILIIATPPETHESIIQTVSSYSYKAVILEKPLAHTIGSAEKTAQLIKKNNLPVIINHERRFANQYRRISEIIESMTYGALLSLSMKLYTGYSRSFRDILYDDGTHILDLANFLVGKYEIDTVSGDENTLVAAASSGGTSILLEAGRKRNYLLFEIDCLFEKGRITAGNGYYREYESRTSPFYTDFRSLVKTDTDFEKSGYFANMFSHACSVAEGRIKSRSSADDALFALRAIENILGLISKTDKT